MTNMQKYAPPTLLMVPLYRSASLLQVGVGLTRMAAMPCRTRRRSALAVALSVAEAMESWFLPALDQDQSDMFTVHPVGVAQTCASTDTLSTTGY